MVRFEGNPPIIEIIAAGEFLQAEALNDPLFPALPDSVVELGLAPDKRLAVNGLMRNFNRHHVSLLNILGLVGREEYLPKEAFYDLGFGADLQTQGALSAGFSKAMNRLRWAVSGPDGESLIDRQTGPYRSALFALSADAYFVNYMTRPNHIDAEDARNQAASLTANKRRSVAKVFRAPS